MRPKCAIRTPQQQIFPLRSDHFELYKSCENCVLKSKQITGLQQNVTEANSASLKINQRKIHLHLHFATKPI
jgi:hypothetical protein